MNAYAYIRVSTSRQEEEGMSLPVQEDRIRKFCEFKGWKVAKVFVESGATATTVDRRPALERAVQATCASKGVLVFYDLSRVARNELDAGLLARRIDDAGSHFASVTEPFDSTAVGKLMFAMMAAFAAFNSRQSGEKIALSNQRTVKLKGYRTNGPQPAGYRLEAGKRVECPREREVITTARTLAAELGYAGAATKLNDDGVKTIATLRGYKRKCRWNRQLVRDLLNKAPAGSAPHG
jgi:site-specific DNA recombinase